VTVYTAAEVAADLRVSTWFVREQVRRGRVACLRVGDAVNAPMRFEPEHVEQLRRLMTPVRAEPKRRRRRRVA
jgi:hypothetical protein